MSEVIIGIFIASLPASIVLGLKELIDYIKKKKRYKEEIKKKEDRIEYLKSMVIEAVEKGGTFYIQYLLLHRMELLELGIITKGNDTFYSWRGNYISPTSNAKGVKLTGYGVEFIQDMKDYKKNLY